MKSLTERHHLGKMYHQKQLASFALGKNSNNFISEAMNIYYHQYLYDTFGRSIHANTKPSRICASTKDTNFSNSKIFQAEPFTCHVNKRNTLICSIQFPLQSLEILYTFYSQTNRTWRYPTRRQKQTLNHSNKN